MPTTLTPSLAALTTPAVPALSPYVECRQAVDGWLAHKTMTAMECEAVLVRHGWDREGRETITGFLGRLRATQAEGTR